MRHVDAQLPLRPAGNARFALVVSRFNEAITSRLLEGARAALVEAGASPDRIAVFTVPGAFELPQMARWAAEPFAPLSRWVQIFLSAAISRT